MNFFFNLDQLVIRSYNSFLRFFQFSILILLCSLLSKMSRVNCSTTMLSISQPISVILLLINLAGICLIKFSNMYSKRLFIGIFFSNMGFSVLLTVMGLLEMGENNSCANNKVMHRFIGFLAFVNVILGFVELWEKYDFALRYTNSPGNMVWVFLFFSFDWSAMFKSFYIPIGVINLLITIANLSVNLVYKISNFNPNIRKPIFLIWIGSLFLMFITQVIAFLAYMRGSNSDSAVDAVAKKLGQLYLMVNIIDGLFWFYGLRGLKINLGESIIQQAFGINQRADRTQIC